MSAAVPLDSDAMRLLAEIGFIGTHTNQFAAARALFESLRVLRPASTLPFIGLAMTHLAADRPLDAARLLRDEGLKQNPADTEMMAFLGLALQTAGQNAEAKKVLCAVAADTTNPDDPHVRMASKLLDEGKSETNPASLMPRWTALAGSIAG